MSSHFASGFHPTGKLYAFPIAFVSAAAEE